MLREAFVVLLCFAGLYAISVHVYNNRRLGGGAVLVAVMFALQVVVHPTAEQAIVQQFEDTAEDDDSGDPDHSASIRKQLRLNAERLQSGQSTRDLVLMLPEECFGSPRSTESAKAHADPSFPIGQRPD